MRTDTTVLEPDVLVVSDRRRGQFTKQHLVGPPDLAIEVSSPSTRRTDLVRKRRIYEREGVPEFWFVDLDADQVQQYSLGEDGTYGPPAVTLSGGVVTSSALSGLSIESNDALAID